MLASYRSRPPLRAGAEVLIACPVGSRAVRSRRAMTEVPTSAPHTARRGSLRRPSRRAKRQPSSGGGAVFAAPEVSPLRASARRRPADGRRGGQRQGAAPPWPGRRQHGLPPSARQRQHKFLKLGHFREQRLGLGVRSRAESSIIVSAGAPVFKTSFFDTFLQPERSILPRRIF